MQSLPSAFFPSPQLIGQYLALRAPSEQPDKIGLISLRASPFEIAQQVIQDAAYMCTRVHGDAPDVSIHGRTDLTFPYVSSHINYMLLELLKNSMRATVETHGVDAKVTVCIMYVCDDVRSCFCMRLILLLSIQSAASHIIIQNCTLCIIQCT